MLIAFLVGVGLLTYPFLSDYYNSFHHTKVIMSYSEKVAKMSDDEYKGILEGAKQYNENLSSTGIKWNMTSEEKENYNKQLHFNDAGTMGYIDIPKINSKLSIFHGTDEKVLHKSVGHLEGTSLPVGGSGSHCALSGHRGLPSAKLFSDLDQLTPGDIFTIHVLNETLTYEVDQIRVVLPNNVSDLKIEQGQDYCTLITCTPYGVNTHRLLVRGHRIDNIDGEARVIADAIQILPMFVAPFLIVPSVILILLYTLVVTRRHKKRYNYFADHGLDRIPVVSKNVSKILKQLI